MQFSRALLDLVQLPTVADSLLDGIDRFFDRLDNGIDGVHRVVNRHKIAEGKIKAVPTTEPSPAAAAQGRKHLALVSSFHIMEVADAVTGEASFIVTDGRDAKCECTSREMAERILRALETSP